MAADKVSSKLDYSSGDSYNGAITERYSWSQTITDIDVKIPVPIEIRKSKDVKVVIGSDRIDISLDPSSSPESHISGQLSHPVVKSECYWNLTPGEAIYMWLQKAQERWWTKLLEGETPIDKKEIEPVRPMEDLPEDDHAKIAELMFNQDQKRKGLPTSDEMRMQDILKKAWDADGSPFKGTPYDPTRVQMGSSTASDLSHTKK